MSQEQMRLNKYLAHTGMASRRAADRLIEQGRVQVNGRTIYAMGVKIDPKKDRITVDGRAVTLRQGESMTLLLNKPVGVLTTRHDPEGRQTVLDLVPPQFHHLRPIGRLDYLSEGLVLLSDDGDLIYRLTHPSYQHEKEYWVQIAGRVPEPALRKLRKGIELEDGMAHARVRHLHKIPLEQRFWLDPRSESKHAWLAFIITEGRKRQIRRMCQAVDLNLLRLVRVRMASLHIGDLRPGQWRSLTARQRRAANAIKASKPVKRQT
jgi:pseudouridine synthase